MKQKMTNFFSEFKKDSKTYIKTNVLFFTFVVGGLISSTLVRYFTLGNYFEVKPVIADLAVLLILGSFAYLFKPKRQIYYFMTMCIFLSTINIANCIYYTFYTSFASVSLLSTAGNITDVSDAVLENVLQIKDFVFLLYPVSLIVVHNILKKKKYYNMVAKIEKGKRRLINTLIVASVITGIFVISLTGTEIGRFNKLWNREFIVMKFGVYTYQFNDIVRSLQPKISTMFGYDQAAKRFRDYYDNKDDTKKTNDYTGIFEGKNIIGIHAESIQLNTLFKTFNGEELTPTLNKLASEGLFFSNFYSQVSVGTSSDTEFTLSTSLMPANSGTVAISYWDREYEALPNLLKAKGYYPFSMHGNKGNFWNRTSIHKTYGYEKFYYDKDYDTSEQIGLGISDKSFFAQSVTKMKKVKEKQNKPFYATLIMLSNHTPFDDTEKYGDFPVSLTVDYYNAETGVTETKEFSYLEDTKLGNYYKSVHYADEALGEFLEALDKEGLLDNTVFMVYGDHDARLSKSEYLFEQNYDLETGEIISTKDPRYKGISYYEYEINRRVPFILWTKDQKYKGEITTPMGMIDVLPTLANMFNFDYTYALGNDVMNLDDNVVVFPNGSWVSKYIYYNNQKEEYLQIANGVLPEDYITNNTEYASEIINISNDIIVYDLIRKSKETEELIKKYD